MIAGPLGVGKTTAVLDFLKRCADTENIAVIVNDFGRAGLDAEVLGASVSGLEIRNVAGGCLCCSAMLDMRDALEAVLQRDGLTRIIIEPSGLVVMPDFVPYLKRLCEEFSLELRPIVSLLNPKRTKESHYRALPYFATLVDHADILVANRVDQCSEPQLEHFREWTAQLNPAKQRIIETSFGALPDEIFELKRQSSGSLLKFYAPHTHEESSGGFTGLVEKLNAKRFRGVMEQWLREGVDGSAMLRFKANLPTEQGWRLFEIAEDAVYVKEMPAAEEAKLDWISKGEVPDEVVRAALEASKAGKNSCKE